MAETITIAGRKFPKTGVYVAGAATAGVVGWAWWTRAREDADLSAAQKAIDESLPGPVEEPTDTPGFTVTGGIAVKTNAEWTREAVLWLQNNGIDAAAASAAIGKFMARQQLTPAEASLVEQAIASTGPPPENGPWQILRQTPGVVTPPPTLPAPTGLRAILLRWNGNTPIYRISWNAVSGAKDYNIRHVGGGNAFTSSTYFDNQGSAPGKVDRWEVAARGVDNKLSAYAPLSFTAASKTGGATPAGVPGNPNLVILTPLGRNRYRVSAGPWIMQPVTYWKVRWEADNGKVSGWANMPHTKDFYWNFKAGTRFHVKVQACNAKGCSSPGKTSNTVAAR